MDKYKIIFHCNRLKYKPKCLEQFIKQFRKFCKNYRKCNRFLMKKIWTNYELNFNKLWTFPIFLILFQISFQIIIYLIRSFGIGTGPPPPKVYGYNFWGSPGPLHAQPMIVTIVGESYKESNKNFSITVYQDGKVKYEYIILITDSNSEQYWT